MGEIKISKQISNGDCVKQDWNDQSQKAAQVKKIEKKENWIKQKWETSIWTKSKKTRHDWK